MEQYTFRTDEFREPPVESRQIHPFCELSSDALPRLNQSLGLDMSVAVFAAIQAVYRERELREPLVGEVRLLATLHSLTASDAARVGEVCTDSDAVAKTWADLMARRRLLAGGVPAPCTLPEILTATDSYLRRLGERPADAPVRVLAEDVACPAAAGARALADGYVPAARFVAGDTARLVCIRRQEDASFRAERAARFASDDLILLARDLPDRAVSAFFRSGEDPHNGEWMTNIVALAGVPCRWRQRRCARTAHIFRRMSFARRVPGISWQSSRAWGRERRTPRALPTSCACGAPICLPSGHSAGR